MSYVPLKQPGHTQVHSARRDVSEGAKGAGWCHCHSLSSLNGHGDGEGPWWLEKGKHHTHLQKGQRGWRGECRPSQLHLPTQKYMKQILLETISRHVKDKKVTVNSHHGFAKHKSCPATLTAFVNETTGSAADEKAADVVSPDHSMSLSMVSPRTRELMTGWVGNWSDHQTRRATVSGS